MQVRMDLTPTAANRATTGRGTGSKWQGFPSDRCSCGIPWSAWNARADHVAVRMQGIATWCGCTQDVSETRKATRLV